MTQANDDCYFYYYSTCNKGTACPFRHEPSARGMEEMCEQWQYGRCIAKHCSKRHMEIQMNRAKIQCYWETQPSGCQKAHCVFRHTKTRSLGNKETDRPANRNEDVPSPKVEPFLIHVEDTDEDSPQKQVRLKPVMSRTGISKKISLKGIGNNETNSQDNETTHTHQSSQMLEQDLLECAKQGITEVLNAGLAQPPSNSQSPVKVKTLKDIKREKILKARLEYERKRLLASQSENNGDGGNVTHADHMTTKQSIKSVEKNKPTSQPSKVKRLSPTSKEDTRGPSTAEFQEVAKLKPIEEVKIKTFEEVMEEKRKRREMLESKTEAQPTKTLTRKPITMDNASKKPAVKINSSNQKVIEKPSMINSSPTKSIISLKVSSPTSKLEKADSPKSDPKPALPVIQPRKMKVRAAKSQPTEKRSLKRPAAPHIETEKEEVPKKIQNCSVRNTSTTKAEAEEIIVKKSAKLTDDPKPLSTSGGTLASDNEVELKEEQSNDGQSTESKEFEGDDDALHDEMDLLEDSGYMKGATYSPAQDIDDDDLMNEMEQLLA